MVLPLFVFDEEIVLPFRVDVQHFAHTYLQLISGKKMGPSHPLDVSYTSLLWPGFNTLESSGRILAAYATSASA
jgi:hypothetical protein